MKTHVKWHLALALALNQTILAEDVQIGGSADDHWPACFVYDQQIVSEMIATAKSINYDWRLGTETGPYTRGGDYLNWSVIEGNPVNSPICTIDNQGVVMVSYDHRKTFVYNPVTIALQAFYLHSIHMKGQPLSPVFKSCVDHLIAMQGADGAIPYQFRFLSLQPGWVSGMAQGTAISAWTRAYKLLGDEKYLRASSASYSFMLLDAERGGCSISLADINPSLDRFKIIREYQFSPDFYVLNGCIFALLGIYDWTEFDAGAMPVLERYVETIRYLLPYYDVGGISAYDLQHISYTRPPKIDPVYHSINTLVVWALDSIMPHPELNRIWHTWAAYLDQPLPEPDPVQHQPFIQSGHYRAGLFKGLQRTSSLTLALNQTISAEDIQIGGSADDHWPACFVYDQQIVSEMVALAKATDYDWRRATERGPYTRGGDYLNWSVTGGNPVNSPICTNDNQGVVKVSYDERKTFVYNPVTIALQAFYLHSIHLKGQPLSPVFKACVDHLIAMQGADGAIRYQFPFLSLEPGWVSGEAHGMAISAWVRAYKLLGDEKYLRASSKAFSFMLLDVEKGGCSISLADIDPSLARFKMIQVYPFSPDFYVLNGAIFALLGIYDWTEFDAGAMPILQQYVEAIRYLLPYYDLGGISSYDLQHISYARPPKIDPVFHSINTLVVWALDSIMPDPELNRIWHTWAAYLDQPLPEPGPAQHQLEPFIRSGHYQVGPFKGLRRTSSPTPPIWRDVVVPFDQLLIRVETKPSFEVYRTLSE